MFIKAVFMENSNGLKASFRNSIQHHLLNWIVSSRYKMVQRGIPKRITLKYLLLLENFLKKVNIII